MSKGIIYYTSNKLEPSIKDGVMQQLKNSGLPITINDRPMEQIGALSMFHQILDCLERSWDKYVFFCEHDVLYHPSHFEFEPERDDTFYYNTNVWKWQYGGDKVIHYDNQVSASGLCVNREFARQFYEKRLEIIYEKGFNAIPTSGNPDWARSMGYEPGKANKLEKQPKTEVWQSTYPNIDIRHGRSLTAPKLKYDDFKRKPTGWTEDVISNLPGWTEPWKLV